MFIIQGSLGFSLLIFLFFFFNDTATTEIYTLSLHDALPIYQAQLIGQGHDQNPAGPARRHHGARQHERGDSPGDGGAAPRAAGGERLSTRRRGERHFHVVARPHGRVPGTRGAAPRVARRAAARRCGSPRGRRTAALHPRPAPLLYHETAARAETYLPARGGQAATGPGEVTGGRLTTERAVVVSAKGAARWQARHPWIYRTDIDDEPRDAAGSGNLPDRRLLRQRH